MTALRLLHTASFTRQCALRRALAIIAFASIVATPLRAQSNTAETLASAIRLYEDLQVERAVVQLRQVVSPNSPYEVSREQRIQAYKYLGAALAVLGQRDSAIVYLRAAVERDPFVDMDAQSFSPDERSALAEARERTFAVAVRPVATAAFDPRNERLTFTVLSTHASSMQVNVRGAGSGAGEFDLATVLNADIDGLREIPWSGVLDDGRLAPPGRYALVATARSRITQRVDSARVWFDLRHAREELEDTLPELTAAELLPERHTTAVAGRDLMRGVGVAAAALVAHVVVGDRHLRGGSAYATTAATAGLTVGVGSFLVRQRHRDIPANVAENLRRQTYRIQRNAEIARRNTERVALTRVVVAPAAGVTP
jgi:tetratricopeptide (TPR) repeat protein